MAQEITVNRIAPGEYQSHDGRVRIARQEPWGGPRWEVTLDGVFVDSGYTLADAKQYAWGALYRERNGITL